MRVWLCVILLAPLLAACSSREPAESCPNSLPIGLAEADEIAADARLPFRFPLDESERDREPFFGWFGVSNECPPDAGPECFRYEQKLFHAAEDYGQPPGTPVYAMADGLVRYSGTAGGYGWLIIVDHPQANLYSLYGHLSPSRWKLPRNVAVQRGDLLAYLGDSDENGGSAESPVVPHLHFGVRAGQMADYPSGGEWRYQAGWIKPCPQDVGWLQPSAVIMSQAIPEGGYQGPAPGLWTRWSIELLVTGAYAIGAAAMMIIGIRRRSRLFLLGPPLVATLAGIVLYSRRVVSTPVLLAIGLVLLLIGVIYAVRQTAPQSAGES